MIMTSRYFWPKGSLVYRLKSNFEYYVELCNWRIVPSSRSDYYLIMDPFVHGLQTTLLSDTVAHSTRPSLRPKINYQPLKKLLSLAVSWVKVVKNCKILTFKVNFLPQKLSEAFYISLLKNIILEAHYLFVTFFENFNFQCQKISESF